MEEEQKHDGNIFFNIFVVLVALILIAVIYTNYQPQETQQVQEVQEESNINNQEENKVENMNENNNDVATSTPASAERTVKNGDTVFVHYTGTLENGTKFDSSLDRGEPFDFVVGAGMVIKGWDQGLLGMKVGEKKRLVLPPDLAYGPNGITMPDGTVVIPKNATLIFDIELISIK
jgi:FKBP-type peptidyl-prolyl cis-trans isomerase